MCTVSLILGHYQKLFPQPEQFPIQEYTNYQKLLSKAHEYDRLMQQKNCPDSTKLDWEERLEKFIHAKRA